jgi:hypothetical protein
MTPLVAVLALALGADAPHVRRLAVLVGANGAPAGRQTLRYAHRDARTLRDALVRVGGVAEADAALLLDPEPSEVVASLERLSGLARAEPAETVLYFYYSGHADETSFYPGGKPLPIELVRQALVRSGATVRVGIFDACRGGAWTRAKGLTPGPPVELRPPWALASEGTVMFASSSGLEEAHESEQLQGSFFTHHLVGGLLGAADTSGDGAVTATEAFQYAQGQTVRDSARAAVDPQHPSFELNLHGRTDLVLTRLEESASTLAVEQAAGPLQVIELPLGLVLLELPEGRRSSRLSVVPGQYLIRRVGEGGVVTAREVRVLAGKTTTIEENTLELVGVSQLDRKGLFTLPAVQQTILPAHTLSATATMGYRALPHYTVVGGGITGDGFRTAVGVQATLAWAPLDWLELAVGARTSDVSDAGGQGTVVPGVTVLAGTRRRNEVTLWGGLDGWALGLGCGAASCPHNPAGFSPVAGVGFRHWFTGSTSLAGMASVLIWLIDTGAAKLVSATGGVVLSHTFRDVVSLNIGLGTTLADSATGTVSASSAALIQVAGLTVGSGRLGFRTLPLLRVHVAPGWSLDLDAQVTLQFTPVGVTVLQQYLAGVTATWDLQPGI